MSSKVLIVIDNLGTGGAQEFIVSFCQNISSDEFSVSVCALRSGGVYHERLENLGVPVLILARSRNIAELPIAMIKLWSIIRSQRYDVLHTILQGSFALGTLIAALAKTPTIHSIMAVRKQLQFWYFPLMKWYQPFVTTYVTPIPEELCLLGVAKEKVKFVEVAIDLKPMLSLSHDPLQNIAPYNLDNARPVVLSIGRLHPDKGHEYAIQAWPHIVQRVPSARLLIVGDGDDERRLRMLVDELSVADSVIFTGYRTDITALLSRADLLLRTSRNEGVNLSVIQGLAAGLPVIGFDNSSPKEIVSSGHNGILVTMADVKALAEAVIYLSNDVELRNMLGQNGRRGVAEYYDITKIVSVYEHIFSAISQKQPITDVHDMHNSMMNFNNHFMVK